MSAWRVGPRTLNLLVNAMIDAEMVEDGAATYKLLYHENSLSLAAYYHHHRPPPVALDEFVREVTNPALKSQIVTSCYSYDYQSCEHDGWPASHAFLLIKSLIRKCDGSDWDGSLEDHWDYDNPQISTTAKEGT